MLVRVNSSCVGIKEQIKTYDHSGLAVIAPTLVVPPPGTKATGESSPGNCISNAVDVMPKAMVLLI